MKEVRLSKGRGKTRLRHGEKRGERKIQSKTEARRKRCKMLENVKINARGWLSGKNV